MESRRQVPPAQHVQTILQIPQVKFLDKAVKKFFVVQRLVRMVQTVKKHLDVLHVQANIKVVRVLAVAQKQIPTVQTIHDTMDPQVQYMDKVVDVLVVCIAQARQLQVAERRSRSHCWLRVGVVQWTFFREAKPFSTGGFQPCQNL